MSLAVCACAKYLLGGGVIRQREAGSCSRTCRKAVAHLAVTSPVSVFRCTAVTARPFSWALPCPPTAPPLGWGPGWGWESSGRMGVEAVWLRRMTPACPDFPASRRAHGWSRAGDRGRSGSGGGPPLWSQSPGLSGRAERGPWWGLGLQQLQAPWMTRPCLRTGSHLGPGGLAGPQGPFPAHTSRSQTMGDPLGSAANRKTSERSWKSGKRNKIPVYTHEKRFYSWCRNVFRIRFVIPSPIEKRELQIYWGECWEQSAQQFYETKHK